MFVATDNIFMTPKAKPLRCLIQSYFHCGGDPSEWDFKGIIEIAKDVKVKKQALTWHDWERYSTRQDTRMKMGGFVGNISFEGNIEPFMQLIKAGEILHVGKGTSFGLGKYRIEYEMLSKYCFSCY